MLAILSAVVLRGQGQMSAICFLCRTQNAELHDSVLDPIENRSSIGYPAFPDVRAYLSWLSLLSYNWFFG